MPPAPAGPAPVAALCLARARGERQGALVLEGLLGPGHAPRPVAAPRYKRLSVKISRSSCAGERRPGAAGRPDVARGSRLPLAGRRRRRGQAGQEVQAEVLIIVIGAPRWSKRNRAWTSTKPTSYARFMTRAARKLPLGPGRSMVWGEPSRAANWSPEALQEDPASPLTHAQTYAPRQYAVMLDEAYGALKAVHRSDLVISRNTFTAGSIEPLSCGTHDEAAQRQDFPRGSTSTASDPFLPAHPQPEGLSAGRGQDIDFSDLPRLQRTVDKALASRATSSGSTCSCPSGASPPTRSRSSTPPTRATQASSSPDSARPPAPRVRASARSACSTSSPTRTAAPQITSAACWTTRASRRPSTTPFRSTRHDRLPFEAPRHTIKQSTEHSNDEEAAHRTKHTISSCGSIDHAPERCAARSSTCSNSRHDDAGASVGLPLQPRMTATISSSGTGGTLRAPHLGRAAATPARHDQRRARARQGHS